MRRLVDGSIAHNEVSGGQSKGKLLIDRRASRKGLVDTTCRRRAWDSDSDTCRDRDIR